MQHSKTINWWPVDDIFKEIYPRKTTSNGNCLLNAVSLLINGHEDVELTMRKQLSNYFRETDIKLRRIWRYQRKISNTEIELTYSEDEWLKEWKMVSELLDVNETDQMKSLEDIHVFGLCNMLKRPIIILAGKFIYNADGEELSPNEMRDIFLPLIYESDECIQNPLVITYGSSHFQPLSTTAGNEAFMLPLVDFDESILPLRYGLDPGYDWNGETEFELSDENKIWFIEQYLSIHEYHGISCVATFENATDQHTEIAMPTANEQKEIAPSTGAGSDRGKKDYRRCNCERSKCWSKTQTRVIQ